MIGQERQLPTVDAHFPPEFIVLLSKKWHQSLHIATTQTTQTLLGSLCSLLDWSPDDFVEKPKWFNGEKGGYSNVLWRSAQLTSQLGHLLHPFSLIGRFGLAFPVTLVAFDGRVRFTTRRATLLYFKQKSPHKSLFIHLLHLHNPQSFVATGKLRSKQVRVSCICNPAHRRHMLSTERSGSAFWQLSERL